MEEEKKEKPSNKTKEGKKEFKTMEEFEKEYFPKSFKEKLLEGITDPHDLGVALAQESLEIIRAGLASK